MSQRVPGRRHARLAAISALLLLGLPAITVPVRAAAAVAIDVHTGDTQVHVGDPIKFLFEVTNPGDAPVKITTISGSLCDSEPAFVSGDTSGEGSLDPGETFLYDCPHEAVEAAHIITNNASVSAAPAGDVPPVTATDSVDVEVLHPAISVDVYMNGPFLVGQKIVYGFLVGNPGDTPINQIVVVADMCLSPIVRSGTDDGNDGWIAPDAMESWGYKCDGPIVGATDTTFHAEAAVRGQDALIKYVDASGAADEIVVHPAITFTSTAKSATAHPGDTITFTYKLTDTGDTHINTVTVLTTACDEGTLKYGDPDDNGALNPGEIWTGSCTHKVIEKTGATVKNVFTFTAAGGMFLEASAQASVSIVAKTAAATPTAAVATAEPSASPGASVEPSAAPSAASAAPVTPPPATPAPSIAPVPASSEGSGFPMVLLIAAIVVLVAMVGGWVVYQRRRLASVR